MTALGDKPYLGRCKECDYALFATLDQIEYVEDFSAVTRGAGAKRVGNNGVFARCTNGHKFFMLRAIKGKYSPDHQCDARCLNAKGHDCTCSCGGANHGRGHILTVHEVPVSPAAVQAGTSPAAPVHSVMDADRHRGHVVRDADEPTQPQLDLIAKLAGQTGVAAQPVATRIEASDEINRLKGIQRAAAPKMTDPQRSFINSLMEQRSMSPESRQEARRQIDAGLTQYEASKWIDRLKELPEIS